MINTYKYCNIISLSIFLCIVWYFVYENWIFLKLQFEKNENKTGGVISVILYFPVHWSSIAALSKPISKPLVILIETRSF